MSEGTFTYDEDTYSDLHKEAYGFRPRGATYARWEAMTPAEKQAEWDYLCDASERSAREERAEEIRCAKVLEERIAETISIGAGDRETAIRWIAEGEDASDDMDYLCYKLGVCFGYFGGRRTQEA